MSFRAWQVTAGCDLIGGGNCFRHDLAVVLCGGPEIFKGHPRARSVSMVCRRWGRDAGSAPDGGTGGGATPRKPGLHRGCGYQVRLVRYARDPGRVHLLPLGTKCHAGHVPGSSDDGEYLRLLPEVIGVLVDMVVTSKLTRSQSVPILKERDLAGVVCSYEEHGCSSVPAARSAVSARAWEMVRLRAKRQIRGAAPPGQ